MAAFLAQSPNSQLRLILVAALLALLWADGAAPGLPLLPLLWFGAVLAMLGWRWRCTKPFVQRVAAVDQPRRIGQVLLASGVLLAMPTLAFGAFSDFGRAVLSMTLVVVATVSIVPTSGYLGIYRAFAWPMVGSVALGWVWMAWAESEPLALLLAVCVLLYLTFLAGVARHASRVFVEGCAYRLGEQQRNAELKLALAAADEANRAKTHFLAAASHDLRQPMHSMSVLVAALSLRPLDAPTREIVDLLGSVNQALSRQLDTLLDISKLDAGIVNAECIPQRLDQIVREHHAGMAPVAQNKGLRVELVVAEPLWVSTDAALLTRALSNLTDNAIKYTPAGGLVRLEARREGERAVLEIRDSGIGIAADEHERVFREFYQVGNVERDRSKGLGLGLSIVQRLCRLLHAELSLESQPGVGTALRLSFDLVAAAEPPRTPPAARSLPPGLRVLVVDDEATVRESLRLLLEGLGCVVHLVDGTEGARGIAGTQALDLVLSDLLLRAGDSGVACIQAVRELQPGVRAMLVTGTTESESLRDVHALGLPLLFKPLSLEQLMAVLSQENDTKAA